MATKKNEPGLRPDPVIPRQVCLQQYVTWRLDFKVLKEVRRQGAFQSSNPFFDFGKEFPMAPITESYLQKAKVLQKNKRFRPICGKGGFCGPIGKMERIEQEASYAVAEASLFS